MEYLLVKSASSTDVTIDGEVNGKTNQLLIVNDGELEVSINDNDPVIVLVEYTTEEEPATIRLA